MTTSTETSIPQIPSVTGTDIRHLLPVAIGVFLVSFCDSILTARSFAGLHNQNVDANQELAALGVANLVSGVTQGFTPSASEPFRCSSHCIPSFTRPEMLRSASLVVTGFRQRKSRCYDSDFRPTWIARFCAFRHVSARRCCCPSCMTCQGSSSPKRWACRTLRRGRC